jgi:hypothetical protein
MEDISILANLGIKWSAVEIHGKKVYVECGPQCEDLIPYYLLDNVIPFLKTARVYLNGSRRQAKAKEFRAWLKQDNTGHNRIKTAFKSIRGETCMTFRFIEKGSLFNAYTQVLTLDYSKKFWILASHDDLIQKGFYLHGAVPSLGLNLEEAFVYLMSVFHIFIYKEILKEKYNIQIPLNEYVVNSHSVPGISLTIQDKAREYAVEAWERIGSQKLIGKECINVLPEQETMSGRIQIIVKDDFWAVSDELASEFAGGKVNIVCVADKTNPMLASGICAGIGEEAIEQAVEFVNIDNRASTLFPRLNLTIIPFYSCIYPERLHGNGIYECLRNVFEINNDLIKCDTLYFNLYNNCSQWDIAGARSLVYLIRKLIFFNEIDDRISKRVIIHHPEKYCRAYGEPEYY